MRDVCCFRSRVADAIVLNMLWGCKCGFIMKILNNGHELFRVYDFQFQQCLCSKYSY